MKNFKFKLILGVATILIMGLLTAEVAKAVSECYPSSSNCVTHAVYYHGVYSGPGSYWEASVTSRTSSPTFTMDHIGYTYWSIQQFCNSNYINGIQYDGHVKQYSSEYYATTIRLKNYCFGDRRGYSLGKHDFYHHTYGFFRPYTAAWALIPD